MARTSATPSIVTALNFRKEVGKMPAPNSSAAKNGSLAVTATVAAFFKSAISFTPPVHRRSVAQALHSSGAAGKDGPLAGCHANRGSLLARAIATCFRLNKIEEWRTAAL
jgi:hypothetical protein